MSYGYVYVASIDMGADKIQALKAFLEAESYDGPSIIVAYSPCQEQGINMTMSQQEGKRAADASYWPLYRYDPRLISQGKNPLQMDSKAQSLPFQEFLEGEIRFRTLKQQYPEEAERLFKLSEEDAKKRLEHLKTLSEDLQKEQKEQKETTPQNNNA
jgi:pyruvate-ferredoxin/flavodoxin oxidoreductase